MTVSCSPAQVGERVGLQRRASYMPSMVRSRAPLRLGLAGGGTDVSPFCDQFGGYVLNATIDMYAYATLEWRDDDQVCLAATDLQRSLTLPLGAEPENANGLGLHWGVYRRIVERFNNNVPIPVTLTTFSDAPPGSGLGSSSTMVVAMVQAFSELLNLPLGEYDIAHLAFEIERVDLGLHGGKQDQYAAAFGGLNFMEFFGDHRVIVNPLRVRSWILSELESSLVLYFTGVSRDSAAIIEQQIANVAQSESPALEAMKALRQDALEMKEAILKGDLRHFAHIMGKSWQNKKRTASAVSNSGVERVFARAMDAGAYAGKLSGAGGGGFLMLFVDPLNRMDVIRTLSEERDGRLFPCHFVEHGSHSWRL